jgi:ribosomal protein L11 methyltransferase
VKNVVERVSFKLEADLADWAGQTLQPYLPEGLLSKGEGSATVLQGWFSGSKEKKSLLVEEIEALGGKSLRFIREKPKNWLRLAKSKFPVQKIGPFLIVPSTPGPHPKGDFASSPIRLIQGQAFGTGLHQSTRLMLKAVGCLAKTEASFPGRVLDIGAGSGILGIACLKSGAVCVDSVEIEAAACAEMRQNRQGNGVGPGSFRILEGGFPGSPGLGRRRYGLVLANLTVDLLLPRLGSLFGRVQPGGRLWMSGIFQEGEKRTLEKACGRLRRKVAGSASLGKWWWLEVRA